MAQPNRPTERESPHQFERSHIQIKKLIPLYQERYLDKKDGLTYLERRRVLNGFVTRISRKLSMDEVETLIEELFEQYTNNPGHTETPSDNPTSGEENDG